MATFIRKRTETEAYRPSSREEPPAWYAEAVASGFLVVLNSGNVLMTTAHGDRAEAHWGDWVLPDRGEGRFYPVKHDIFQATYDPADVA